MKNILVLLDRDGTQIKDEDYYPGTHLDWKNQIEILPTVIEGIKLLQERGVDIATISNQAGVALCGTHNGINFDALDEKKMHEVQNFIDEKYKQHNIKPFPVFFCPFVDEEYAKKQRAKGRTINEKYVKETNEIKPKPGLAIKAATLLNKDIKNYESIHVIGDRISDLELALNLNMHHPRAYGYLVPAFKTTQQSHDEITVLTKKHPNLRICKTFLDAVEKILKIIESYAD